MQPSRNSTGFRYCPVTAEPLCFPARRKGRSGERLQLWVPDSSSHEAEDASLPAVHGGRVAGNSVDLGCTQSLTPFWLLSRNPVAWKEQASREWTGSEPSRGRQEEVGAASGRPMLRRRLRSAERVAQITGAWPQLKGRALPIWGSKQPAHLHGHIGQVTRFQELQVSTTIASAFPASFGDDGWNCVHGAENRAMRIE